MNKLQTVQDALARNLLDPGDPEHDALADLQDSIVKDLMQEYAESGTMRGSDQTDLELDEGLELLKRSAMESTLNESSKVARSHWWRYGQHMNYLVLSRASGLVDANWAKIKQEHLEEVEREHFGI